MESESLQALEQVIPLTPELGTAGRVLSWRAGVVSLRVERDGRWPLRLSVDGLQLGFDAVPAQGAPRGFRALDGVHGRVFGATKGVLPLLRGDLWQVVCASGGCLAADGIRWDRWASADVVASGAELLRELAIRLGVGLEHASWPEALRALEKGEEVWERGVLASRPNTDIPSILRLSRALDGRVTHDWEAEVIEVVAHQRDTASVAAVMLDGSDPMVDDVLEVVRRWSDAERRAIAGLRSVVERRPSWWASTVGSLGSVVLPQGLLARDAVALLGDQLTSRGVAVSLVISLLRGGENQTAELVLHRMDEQLSEYDRGVMWLRVLDGCQSKHRQWLFRRAARSANWQQLADLVDAMLARGEQLRSWWEAFIQAALANGEAMPGAVSSSLTRRLRGELDGGAEVAHALLWLQVLAARADHGVEVDLLGWLDSTSEHEVRLALIETLGSVGTAASIAPLRGLDLLLAPGDVRRASRSARAAIEARIAGRGSLSVAEGAGRLSTSQGGRISRSDE